MRKTLRQGIVLWLTVTCTLPFVLAHPARSSARRHHPTPEPVAETVHRMQSPTDELRDTETAYRFHRLRRYRRAERVEEVVETVCARSLCQMAAVEFVLTEVPRDPIDGCDGPWVSLAPPIVPLRC
jgi:hypothetical protein